MRRWLPAALGLALVWTASGGAVAHAEPGRPANHESAAANQLGKPADVESLLALRGLGRRELMALLHLAPGDVRADGAYQRLQHVALLHNGAIYPGHFYVRGDRLEVAYVGDASFLSGLTAAAIRRELGGAGARLRSRAGKAANQYVYADRGFAYSETDGAVDFVEIFPPMSLEQYRAKIYEEPGVFTK